jgi:hypothetical protein
MMIQGMVRAAGNRNGFHIAADAAIDKMRIAIDDKPVKAQESVTLRIMFVFLGIHRIHVRLSRNIIAVDKFIANNERDCKK